LIKVCLVGLGKTGKEIARMLSEMKDIKIISAICSPGSEKKSMDLGKVIGKQNSGIIIEEINKLEEVILKNKPDVIVDFSRPDATLKTTVIISKMKINMVIGTTGFSSRELKKIKTLTYHNHIGTVYAPNITPGVNVLMILSNLASILLSNYDFCITEIHHKNKKDSPSGTAVKIAGEIERGLHYAGKTTHGEEIPINSVRAGGVVGKHEVMIAGEEDRIIISHESFSRKIFASGALHAIRFIYNKTGYYEMKDVLCLQKILEDLYLNNDELDSELGT
jgi:4-hydroxy-tetrahydrodipicolinate reductase